MGRALYILGASGLAREMAQLAKHAGPPDDTEWDFAGFVDADSSDIGKDLRYGRIVGDDDWLLESDAEADLIVGIGQPNVRARVVGRYLTRAERFRFPNLIHPTAIVELDKVSVGRGNCVTAGCIFTCDIAVGDFNLFNWQTTVGHDARVGSFNVINPGVNISGGVHLADRILVGTGAQVLERVKVRSGATIGAGAVVTKDVDADITVVGVPARPLQH